MPPESEELNLSEKQLHSWLDLPPGVYEGANRYSTDDEEVLTVWRDGETWDVRADRALGKWLPDPPAEQEPTNEERCAGYGHPPWPDPDSPRCYCGEASFIDFDPPAKTTASVHIGTQHAPLDAEQEGERWTIYPQEWNGSNRARWIEGPRPKVDHRKGLEVVPASKYEAMRELYIEENNSRAASEVRYEKLRNQMEWKPKALYERAQSLERDLAAALARVRVAEEQRDSQARGARFAAEAFRSCKDERDAALAALRELVEARGPEARRAARAKARALLPKENS